MFSGAMGGVVWSLVNGWRNTPKRGERRLKEEAENAKKKAESDRT